MLGSNKQRGNISDQYNSILLSKTCPSQVCDSSTWKDTQQMESSKDTRDFITLDPSHLIKSNELQFSEASSSNNLLDDFQSSDNNLPSPLKPATLLCDDYHGFSVQGSHIPTIPCSTGDLSYKTMSEELSVKNQTNIYKK